MVGGLIIVRSQGLICFDDMSILTSLFSWAVRLLGGYRETEPDLSYFVSCASMVFGFRGRIAENGGLGWWFCSCVIKVMGSGFRSLSTISDYSYFVIGGYLVKFL